MVQSVELLLDEATDALVRRQWERLAAAGLPSLARQGSGAGIPHVTLAARRWIDPASEPGVRVAARALPIPLRLGALACFGRSRFVLVRLVAVDVELLGLHARVAAALGPDADDPDQQGNLAPGRWTPHVTLGRRFSPEQVTAALGILDGAGWHAGLAASCRRWDGDGKRQWPV